MPPPHGDPTQIRDTQLTDAQIRNLKATPVEVLPAPGPGKVNVLLNVYYVLDAQAGAYVGANYTNLVYAGHESRALDQLLGVWNIAGRTASYGVGSALADLPENAPVVIRNFGDGEWTGGHPANTLSVRVFYFTADLAPF